MSDDRIKETGQGEAEETDPSCAPPVCFAVIKGPIFAETSLNPGDFDLAGVLFDEGNVSSIPASVVAKNRLEVMADGTVDVTLRLYTMHYSAEDEAWTVEPYEGATVSTRCTVIPENRAMDLGVEILLAGRPASEIDEIMTAQSAAFAAAELLGVACPMTSHLDLVIDLSAISKAFSACGCDLEQQLGTSSSSLDGDQSGDECAEPSVVAGTGLKLATVGLGRMASKI